VPKQEIELQGEERAAIDEICAEIEGMNARRTGMLLFAVRAKGIKKATIEAYGNGKITISVPEAPKV